MEDNELLRIELLLLFAESLLFGAFCVLYLMSLWVLVCRQRSSERSPASLWMAGVVTAMFALAGTFLAFDIRHLVAAFVNHSATPGGALAYIWQRSVDPSRSLDPVIFVAMTLLWDAFMTYRIFMVWNRKPVSLLLPVLLMAGNLVSAGFLGDGLLWAGNPHNGDSLLLPHLHPRFMALFVTTLFTNLVMTLLLLGRLWWYDRRTQRYRFPDTSDSAHWRVMRTIICSELAYSLGVVLNLAACAAGSKLVLISSAVLPPVIGISFTLMIMRIGLSEALADGADRGPAEAQAAALHDPAGALSRIAVNVHISHSIDSEDVSMCEDKTVSACHGTVEPDGGSVDDRGTAL